MKTDKKEFRREAIKQRDSLSAMERKEKSSLVIKRLMTLKEFRDAAYVMSFISFGSEVETNALIQYCLDEGKQIAVPKVIKADNEGKRLIAVRIGSMETGFKAGSYGIPEPTETEGRIVQPEDLEFVVVPGVAFDTKRFRLGYGGGFYDRFLGGTRKSCMKAAVAYECQVYAEIPLEAHDLQMDCVITESNIY
ncbi:MAG: 5-formyltetrahydrofolate cyclo-ligase [Clostridia bacterium]|nr:5-formyltetrahydrofolate cyclo-ligase [Clostridia bacterium]